MQTFCFCLVQELFSCLFFVKLKIIDKSENEKHRNKNTIGWKRSNGLNQRSQLIIIEGFIKALSGRTSGEARFNGWQIFGFVVAGLAAVRVEIF